MKKLILGVGASLCLSVAQASSSHMWTYIQMLQNDVAWLKQKVASIPAGPQGSQGPKGEQGPAGHYTAGEGITIEGDIISTHSLSHHIGEFYQGGVVFWVDKTGQHGLIASRHDLYENQGVQWRNGESGNKVTNARADGIGAGETNTRLIVAQQTADNQAGQFAALIAVNYSVQDDGETPCATPIPSNIPCYGGWYLPSLYELALLKDNLQAQGIAQFAPDYYWSSTEASVSDAWLHNFSSGEFLQCDKANTLGHVRAVRQF